MQPPRLRNGHRNTIKGGTVTAGHAGGNRCGKKDKTDAFREGFKTRAYRQFVGSAWCEPIDAGIANQEGRRTPQGVPADAMLKAHKSSVRIRRIKVKRPSNGESLRTQIFHLENTTWN